MTQIESPRRRRFGAGLVVLGVAGISMSAAASLGLGSSDLGAGTAVVAACQPASRPIAVHFANDYDPAIKGFAVTSVELRELDPGCVGQHVSVALTSGSGARLSEVSGTVSGSNQAFALPSSVAAQAVTGTAVVIAD